MNLTVLFHGTWGGPEDWDIRTQDLCRRVFDSSVINYNWKPAHLAHLSRERAARVIAPSLIKWRTDNPDGILTCIGQSHGGNVIFLLDRFIPREYYPNLVITFGCPLMGFYDSDYSTLTSQRPVGVRTKWLAVCSTNDGVQVIGSVGRGLANQRIDECCDEYLIYSDLHHRDMFNCPRVWSDIEKKIIEKKLFD